jgi:hypothetical protein
MDGFLMIARKALYGVSKHRLFAKLPCCLPNKRSRTRSTLPTSWFV